jgi:mannosyltransferase
MAHMVALLLVSAHAIVVWKARPGRKRIIAWLAAVVVGILPALPVVYLGQEQTDRQIAWIPEITLQRVVNTPEGLFGGAVLAGAVVALALVAMTMTRPTLVATTWAVVPAIGLAIVSQVTPMWIARYLLFIVPGWMLLASHALRQATILRGTVGVLLLGALAFPSQLDLRKPTGHQQDTKSIALVLLEHSLPGDTIVYGAFANGDQRVSRDAVNRYVPADKRPEDVLMTKPARTDGFFGALECGDEDVPICLGKPQRVWVVRKATLADPIQGMGPAKEVALRASYITSRTWQVKAFTIALLTRKPEK